ncbi:MAG: phosphoribosyl-AMP cyclohydrolase, partial [Fervidobacterium pennivorans]
MELIPVIVQEINTKEVLMLAYANQEAIELTKQTGYAHFYSRSRNKIWKKGEESGNAMPVVKIIEDCDNDTLLYLVNFPKEKVAC